MLHPNSAQTDTADQETNADQQAHHEDVLPDMIHGCCDHYNWPVVMVEVEVAVAPM